jgi:hypothetical protein
MGGLMTDPAARVIIRGRAFMQNLRGRHYESVSRPQPPSPSGGRRSTNSPAPFDPAPEYTDSVSHRDHQRNISAGEPKNHAERIRPRR